MRGHCGLAAGRRCCGQLLGGAAEGTDRVCYGRESTSRGNRSCSALGYRLADNPRRIRFAALCAFPRREQDCVRSPPRRSGAKCSLRRPGALKYRRRGAAGDPGCASGSGSLSSTGRWTASLSQRFARAAVYPLVAGWTASAPPQKDGRSHAGLAAVNRSAWRRRPDHTFADRHRGCCLVGRRLCGDLQAPARACSRAPSPGPRSEGRISIR